MKITLPLPPPTNATYKVGKGRMYKSAEAVQWANDAFYTIKTVPNHDRFIKDVEVHLTFFMNNMRDIDGAVKPILDVLQNAKVIDNDRNVKKTMITKVIDTIKPRVEVEVSQL